MSNFLIFKAAFNNSATPAIGTYTAEGATAQFNRNTGISPDYYLYNTAAGTAVQWFVPTAETTDFEFVADILTRNWSNNVTYFIIADSTGTTRLRMWSQYDNWDFENSDSTAGSGDPEYIGTVNPITSGGFGVFHQFRVRVRKLTDSSSSVEVYVDGTLKLTATAGAALVTCAKIGFVGGVGTFGPGTDAGIKNAYVYDLSDGDVIDRGVLSGAFNRFISWMKSKFALKSDIPTVNDATLTIQQNGVNVQTFTANQSTAATANIQCVDLTSAQTIGGDKDFTGTTGTRDVIPATTDTYNLGSSSYQWNNLYSKNYYYNGVAWGLDKANTWSAHQKIVGSNSRGTVSMYNSAYAKGSALSSTDLALGTIFMGDGGQAGLANSLGFISTNLANNGSITSLSLSAIENTASSGVRTNVVILYDKNDAENPRKVTVQGTVIPHADATYSLGTSTYKWKSFNGINPGALSLPGTSVNVDTTNWVLDGSNANIFTPTSDGWLGIQAIDTVYDQMHYVFIGRTGGGSTYYQQNLAVTVNALWDSKYHGCVFIPVVKGQSYHIRCICSTIIATFYPCQGNV